MTNILNLQALLVGTFTIFRPHVTAGEYDGTIHAVLLKELEE